MHVLFVHRSFPAQFGHIAHRLAVGHGYRCTFVSEQPSGKVAGIERIQYRPRGGATERTHYSARTFENGVWHAAGVYEALRPLAAELRPDLIVGHSGWGSTLFLHHLFAGVPVLGYFEYFYRATGGDLGFRPDMPVAERDRLRIRARNAMLLLDLEYCAAGYTPTQFQWGMLPDAYRPKVRVVHDGIDTAFWRPRDVQGRTVAGLALPPGARLVTYASRGLEAMRGFDVFMRAAKRICDARPDVVVAIVGGEHSAYGSDLALTGGKTLKQHVLEQDDYDPDRIRFLGRLAPDDLARLLSLSDLHVYLTVPFVLSWSLLNAMACGATVLASDTEPVREVVADGLNGMLCDFFDDRGLAERALAALDDPDARARLGRAAREFVEERYGMDAVMPAIIRLYEEVAGRGAR